MEKTSRKRPTIRDVARVAKVSTATVSRALQSPELVTENTRKAVFDAVTQTGYSVNTAAQMLRRNRSGTVLVILPDISNPFFSEILSGIEKIATHEKLTILIGNTNNEPERFTNILENLRNGRADGALLLNGVAPPADMLPEHTPMVTISERIAGYTLPHVGTDNEAAAYDSTQHLISLGHSSIAHVTGPEGNQLTNDRRAGYERAMRDARLSGNMCEIQGGFEFQDGKEAATALMRQPTKPTAVFCANDESAMGVIRGLEGAGYNVPRDYSVIGFDNVSFSHIFSPELTTVHQARYAIGVKAMEVLLALMGGQVTKSTIFLPHKIIERSTTLPNP
ncbi:LacI family DNA-binding transcriptional regulator [Aliiroseovarius sp. 2305UL8-7]|uniref:LacI family DNA-binding transcriptional regulator n=1 Tax=Aliiroseovarius conchicola TaxID=3121637 RepID=UPI0035287B5F